MSFPPGPFHVYIRDEKSSYPGRWYLVTFPSRSSADEYWRLVQQTLNPMKNSLPYRRHHSQYFISPLPNSLSQNHNAGQDLSLSCISQMCGSSLSNFEARIVPLPLSHDQRPDNINGGTYYIRSAIRPEFFWVDQRSASRPIRLSTQGQTKFIIRRATPLSFDSRPKEDILTNNDDINIFVCPPGWENDEKGVETMIIKNSQNCLVPVLVSSLGKRVGEVGVFKFGMFDKGFGVNSELDWGGGVVYASPRLNGGERWEFVR